MILLIDNQDSFTYNLFHGIERLGRSCVIVQAKDADIELVRQLAPSGLILSPGPGNPSQAHQAAKLVQSFYATLPILGVCLGHQIIGDCFGASWGVSKEPTYGKATEIHHQGKRIFDGLSQPMVAARYHSLALHSLPKDFEALAWSSSGELMAMGHRTKPVYGIQFHPESFLSPEGLDLLGQFCKECDVY